MLPKMDDDEALEAELAAEDADEDADDAFTEAMLELWNQNQRVSIDRRVARAEARIIYMTLETLLAEAEADLAAEEARDEMVLLTDAVGTALDVALAELEGRAVEVALAELEGRALEVALAEDEGTPLEVALTELEGRALEVALAERLAEGVAPEEVVLLVRMVE